MMPPRSVTRALMRRCAAARGALLLAVALTVSLPHGRAADSETCSADGGVATDAADMASPDCATASSTTEDSSTAEDSLAAEDRARLTAAGLIIPVAGVLRVNLRDSFSECRGLHRHQAIDIAAPLGTPVIAAGDGQVVKLFTSVPGGLTIYQFDPDERFAYYYAHLDAYAPGLSEGAQLKRGDLLGYVGATGNAAAAAPHLHFAIFRLGPDREWWKGAAVNPYLFLNDANR